MAPDEMRVASFRIKGQGTKQADVSVIPLPGMAGGDINNVNRWRSQVGLAPVTQEQLAKLVEEVEIAGSKTSLYDQAGVNPAEGEKSRILGTILHRDETAWFFKMTGDDELVAQQKPAFVDFLKSVRFAAAAKAWKTSACRSSRHEEALSSFAGFAPGFEVSLVTSAATKKGIGAVHGGGWGRGFRVAAHSWAPDATDLKRRSPPINALR